MNITKETAKKLYEESPEWFQEQLVKEFGKKLFELKSYENIKTFEDACKALNINPDEVFHSNDTSDEIAYKKLKVIVKAVNNGWIPDWNDSNEKKWWPWFNLSSGFGFSNSFYYCGNAGTTVGSRLCFDSEEKSNYAANQFIDLYKELLTINN